MHSSLSDSVRVRYLSVTLLTVFWFAGFCCGLLLYRSCELIFVSLMRSASGCAVSIVALMTVVILPYSITVYVVVCSKKYFIYLLCFLKALLYSVSVLAIYGAFGGGGWLIQLLLMLTDNFATILLLILWLQILSGKRMNLLVVAQFGIISCMVWVIDLVIISPILVSLMNI